MTTEKHAALDAVMTFLDSYAKRDVEGCMEAITDSRPVLIFGTNDNEVFSTLDDLRAAFTRDFANMSDIHWGKERHAHVEAAETLASVIIELSISFQSEGEEVDTLFRYALTLGKEGGQWKICAGMASVPFASGTYSFAE